MEDDDSRAISWIQLVAALVALGAVGLLVSMWLLGDGDGGSNAETANVEDTTVLEIPNSEPAAVTEPAPTTAAPSTTTAADDADDIVSERSQER